MYIKRYTVAAFILITLIGSYVFTYITQDKISLEFFGIIIPPLHIAAWVVISLGVLYVATIFHMSFYAILASLRLRKYDKDYENLIDAIADAYLAKGERNHIYKTPRYKLLGSIIDSTTLFPTPALRANTQNEELDTVINIIEDIKRGEVVDLKKYSLKTSNSLVIQNERNRYKKGDITAEDILANISDYDTTIVQEAYTDFVNIGSLSVIEEHKVYLTKELLYVILARANRGDNPLVISNESLLSLFKTIELDTKDLIKISSVLSNGIIPEQRMKLFEILSESREDAIEAYLFTLFDLEMFSPADDILIPSQANEYLNFKAYRALKESGKNFNINLFV